MQNNIQYIKDTHTNALGTEYCCPQIKKQATVPDVFLHHFGVCEDISVSIGILLSFNHIPFEIIQANGHAWLVVELNGDHFIWDCTRNITRNEHKRFASLQASSYSYKYTLIGANTFAGDYPSNSILSHLSEVSYPRSEIQDCINQLQLQNYCDFSYSDKSNYYSEIVVKE